MHRCPAGFVVDEGLLDNDVVVLGHDGDGRVVSIN
jgi:hypothetical protein